MTATASSELRPGPRPAETAHDSPAQRPLRGDRSAFEQIVAAHQERVSGLAYRLLGWSSDVEDVVQEVFLAAMTALPKFRGEAQLSTWLTRITINTCRTWRRRRLIRLAWLTGRANKAHVAADKTADQQTMDREAFDQVRRAVRGLPFRYREVVVLRYLEEMTVESISEVLGVSRNNVEVRLHRARTCLRDQLAGLIRE